MCMFIITLTLESVSMDVSVGRCYLMKLKGRYAQFFQCDNLDL